MSKPITKEKIKHMTYLKIENNKGYYRILDGDDNWIEIDKINKDDLLRLLQLATLEDFEMQEYEDDLLQNPAHNIIYKNIHNKFSEVLSNKVRFQDSSNRMYKEALEKYRVNGVESDEEE